jgi:hypothetical protein
VVDATAEKDHNPGPQSKAIGLLDGIRSTYEEKWSQVMKKRKSFMDSRVAHLLFRLMARVMESPLR